MVALNACAGVLDELAVLDAGGAGGFAGAAVEAFINVIDEGVGDGSAVLRDVHHLADAAARGVGFETPEAVGGASVEAEPAVDAAGVVLVDGGWARDGGRGHGSGCGEGRMIRLWRMDRKNSWSCAGLGWQRRTARSGCATKASGAGFEMGSFGIHPAVFVPQNRPGCTIRIRVANTGVTRHGGQAGYVAWKSG